MVRRYRARDDPCCPARVCRLFRTLLPWMRLFFVLKLTLVQRGREGTTPDTAETLVGEVSRRSERTDTGTGDGDRGVEGEAATAPDVVEFRRESECTGFHWYCG